MGRLRHRGRTEPAPAGACSVRRSLGVRPSALRNRRPLVVRAPSLRRRAGRCMELARPRVPCTNRLAVMGGSDFPAVRTSSRSRAGRERGRCAPIRSTGGCAASPAGAVASTSGHPYGGGRPTEVGAMAKAESDRSGVLGFLTSRRCWACRERYSRRLPNCPHCKAKRDERPGLGSAASGFAPMPPAGEARRPGPLKGDR
jgi:hypothetical protein